MFIDKFYRNNLINLSIKFENSYNEKLKIILNEYIKIIFDHTYILKKKCSSRK